MKNICTGFLVSFTAIFLNTSFAISAPKQVTLPFKDEPIFSETHNGLNFEYLLWAVPTNSIKKVVCTLSSTYKSWLEGKDLISYSPTFGGTNTITLEFRGQAAEVDKINKDYNQPYILYIDISGNLTLYDTPYGQHSTASCHYENDSLQNNAPVHSEL